MLEHWYGAMFSSPLESHLCYRFCRKHLGWRLDPLPLPLPLLLLRWRWLSWSRLNLRRWVASSLRLGDGLKPWLD
uniref:Uncharacterized protein n=1 Tax=Solanum lycopersicum TaxID=4081 RepID=A0A3Q7F6I9_SOLLC